MPRTPSIRYYNSRGAYYTKYQGKQHLLAAGPKDEPDGPTYQAAVLRFARIMHVGVGAAAEDDCLVSVVIARYYHHLDREKRVRARQIARSVLDHAIADFGHVKVRELKPFAVNDWLDKMKQWGDSTKSLAVGNLGTALNWAVKQGVITKNPVAGMQKPEQRVRGKEVILPEELQEVIITAANPAFGRLLRFLQQTGCRPGEATHACTHHYHPQIAAIVYPWNPQPGEYRWKSAKRTKRDRVIYLTEPMKELIEAEVARWGSGPIFRTLRGKSWKPTNLVNHMDRAALKAPVQKWCRQNHFDAGKIMCYGWRHSYITAMLKRGCPIKLLADLCGTSVLMIERNYSKVHDDHAAMRQLLLQFAAPTSQAQ